jgi:ferredoxin
LKFAKIFILGKYYRVPSQLTVLKATEYAGYRIVRGCGCRGGVCGACSFVYRLSGSYEIHAALACVTEVQDGMQILYLSNFPSRKATYDIDQLTPDIQTILKLYPEIERCMGCNTCTLVCPQDVKVMEVISAVLRAEFDKAAELSSKCVMCGLCAAKCPAGLSPHNIAILCRRLYGKYLVPKYQHVIDRILQLENNEYDHEMNALLKLDEASLKHEYKIAQNDKQLI